jgi:hypothetical protein
MGIERQKDFLITGTAKPTFATGFDWIRKALSYVPVGSARLWWLNASRGPIFNGKEEAEQHGFSFAS